MGVMCTLLLLFLCRVSTALNTTTTGSPIAGGAYFMSAHPIQTQTDALNYCAQYGATLASILNQADYDDAVSAELCSGNRTCWTGLYAQHLADGADIWQWENGAPLTSFGFSYSDSISPYPVSGRPWASAEPNTTYGDCVCLNTNGTKSNGFFSCECDNSGINEDWFDDAYALCGNAKFEVLLNAEDDFFSDSMRDTGIENPDDPSAGAFSIIGLQGDGEDLRYGGGDFIFRYQFFGYYNNEFYGAYETTWSQSTWLTEARARNVSGWPCYYVDNTTQCWSASDFGGLFLANATDSAGYLTDGQGNAYGHFQPSQFGTPIWPSGFSAVTEQLSVYVDGFWSGAGYIVVTSCDGWNTADTVGTLSISLRGSNRTTPFILVNPFSTGLPYDGQSAVFNFDTSKLNVGTLLSVTLEASVETGFCMSGLSIVPNIEQCEYGLDDDEALRNCGTVFGEDYFGNGMVLKPDCPSLFVDVLGGDDDPLLMCYDETFLDLHTDTKRGIVDLSIHSCNLECADIDALADGELSVVLSGKAGLSATFASSDVVPLTIGDDWAINTYRRFEINVDVPLTTVVMARLLYSGTDDDLCVDLLFANDLSATYLSHNWIGAARDSQSLSAVFKWPVCATEVINVRVDSEYSSADVNSGAAFISGLKCSNYNRIASSTCSISQSYDTSKTTSFSFAESTSTGTSTNTDYQWGQEVGIGSDLSVENSVSEGGSFTLGTSREVSVGWGPLEASASISAEKSWTRDTTSTTSATSSSTWSTNKALSQGSGTSTDSSSSTDNSWSTTESSSITCSASISVPPSHSISYNLLSNALDATFRTYSDMKLTLCSTLLEDDDGEAIGEQYVYITDIPGTIRHSETTACEVQFEKARYLANNVGCAEEEKLAIAAGSDFIPRCQSGNSTQYEACQCDIGYSLTMGVCWCSDEQGNPIETMIHQFDGEKQTDAEVCAQLACDGATFAPASSPSSTSTPTSSTSSPSAPSSTPSAPTSNPITSAPASPNITSPTNNDVETETETETETDADEDDGALVQEDESDESDESELEVNADLINNVMVLLTVLICVAIAVLLCYAAAWMAKCWKHGLSGADAAANERKSGMEMEMAAANATPKETV